jgi:hypothetical protein
MKSTWVGVVRWMAMVLVVGCAKDEDALRPARSPDRPPAHGADSPPALSAPPIATPPPLVSAATPPAALKDPMLSGEPKDCGPARDNPHGIQSAAPRRDGSCQVCERAPEALPACSAKERASVTRARDLKGRASQRVLLQGTLRVGNFFCTKRGGICACNNRCGTALLLARPGDVQPLALTSKNEPLSCAGDDASVCCPFELAGQKRSVEVIASGTWLEADLAAPQGHPSAEPHLEVEKLCKL